MTARTHAAVRAAVILGVIASIALFIAIGVVWLRRAQFTLHHRSNSTGSRLDSAAMSHSKTHALRVQLPKPLSRVHDFGDGLVKPLPFGLSSGTVGFGKPGPSDSYRGDSHGSFSQRETDRISATITTVSGSSYFALNRPDIRGSPVRIQPRSLLGDAQTTTNARRFRSSEAHSLVQFGTPAHRDLAVTTQDHPAHLISERLELSSTLAALLIPSPIMPTQPLLGGTKPSRHDQLDNTFAFPSPPPTPNGSIIATLSDFSLPSLSSSMDDSIEGLYDESLIWSDVFSLDEYGYEDEYTPHRSSISVQDQLPSPPPTPTPAPTVLFTPPSPPSTLLASASTPAEVDTERLHVWRSAVKKVRINNDNEKPKGEEVIAAGRQRHNEYNISTDLHKGLTAFTLAHGQAKMARARRGNKDELHRDSKVDKNIREDSPPAYQSLGYEFQSRLAQKRVSSFSANIPIDEELTTQILLDRVAAIAKPRPTLGDFEPLLCRKVNIPKINAWRISLGFQGHLLLSNAPGVFDQASSRTQIVLDAPADTVVLKDERTDEMAVMGLAV